MHDVKRIREEGVRFDEALRYRGVEEGVSARVIALDDERLRLLKERELLLEERNRLSKEMGILAREGGDSGEELRLRVQEIKARLEVLSEGMKDASDRLEALLLTLPNVAYSDVPDGDDESSNEEEDREGAVAEDQDLGLQHFEVASALGAGLMDFESGSLLSGARFVVLKGVLAKLERALSQMMMDLHTEIHGYTEMSVPFLVLPEVMEGTGQLPKFADDLFRTNSPGGHYLIPTAEVPLTNMVRSQVLSRSELPLRMVSYTQCFRKEAGSAGKDTRGMLRQHQFGKVELVSVTCPEDSESEHERMTECAKEVLRRLELPFRSVKLSKGDMGFSAKRTIDLEVWMPGQGVYREISSCSTCGDFQARRMGGRVKREGGKGTEYVHTLNGSGVAVGRAMIAILENGYCGDGSVKLPEALHGYMGGMKAIELEG
jgi:seryl-tRNA synthetase